MAVSKETRIILDTNLWVSFLITKDHSKLTSLLLKKKIRLLFSDELLNEFIEVAFRPKFRKYFSRADVQELINAMEQYIDLIKVVPNVDLCRDKKDNFLLDLSIDGKADYLISGDKDLLELKKVGKTKIITISEFQSNSDIS